MAKKKATQSKSEILDFSKYIRWFWMAFAGGILAVILLFLLASWGALGDMPDHTRLENPETNLALQTEKHLVNFILMIIEHLLVMRTYLKI